MRAFLLGALTALTIMPANAAEDAQTANFILPYCKLDFKEAGTDTTSTMLHGYCYGTIYGLSQMLGLVQDTKQVDPFLCTTMPRSVTAEQVVNVVIKFAEAHPEVARDPFITVVFVAIRDTWPCTN